MDDFKEKRLLLQGASRGNLGLIKTAKEHGVYVVMTGLGGDYPCNPYADKFRYADISDPEAILKVAREEAVDGAVICCSDTGLKAIGRCNDVLGLTGLTERAADESSNKFLMKERLLDAGVRTAQFFKIHNVEELKDAVKKIGFPVIIKAIDLQGSRGINIVRNGSTLLTAFNDTMSITNKDYCIVEEFIIGQEFGAQSFVYNGKVLFVLPHGDETVMCKTAVPVGHFMPYDINSTLYKDVCEQVRLAIKALHFDNCAVNVDLIERDGKVYVIELTGRVGANCLPELTSNYYGINYYEMILATCLGESPLPYWNRRQTPCSTLARMIRSEKAGIVDSISVPEMPDAYVNMFIHKGSEVRVFTNSNDAIGEVVVKGDTLKECKEKIVDILSRIKIYYE